MNNPIKNKMYDWRYFSNCNRDSNTSYFTFYNLSGKRTIAQWTNDHISFENWIYVKVEPKIIRKEQIGFFKRILLWLAKI